MCERNNGCRRQGFLGCSTGWVDGVTVQPGITRFANEPSLSNPTLEKLALPLDKRYVSRSVSPGPTPVSETPARAPRGVNSPDVVSKQLPIGATPMKLSMGKDI